MPRFTPADPSLVAFNPQAVTGGVLQSIQLANEFSKRKAFLQQQADEAAVRDARIASELARYGITTNTAPGEIAATNARNAGTTKSTPFLTDAQIAKAQQVSAVTPGETKAIIADQNFNEAERPRVEEARAIRNMAELSAAEIKAYLEIEKASNDLAKARADGLIEPAQAELAARDIQERLDSFEKSHKQDSEMKQAAIEELKSKARLNNAHANPQGDSREKALSRLQVNAGRLDTGIKSLESFKVAAPDGGVTVPLTQYRANTRDASGNPLTERSWWKFGLGAGDPVPRNPQAEKALTQLDRLLNARETLNKQIADAVVSDMDQSGGMPQIRVDVPGEQAGPSGQADQVPATTIGGGQPQQAPTKDQILDAVRSGQLTPDAAKELARQLGLK